MKPRKSFMRLLLVGLLCINFVTIPATSNACWFTDLFKSAQDTACANGPLIKAKIRSALQIAQVGYPLIAHMASVSPNPVVLEKVALVDAALDMLGFLAYELLCPDTMALEEANSQLTKAQEAKAALGVK